ACPADSSPPPSAGPSMAATTTFPNISILLLTETAGCANSAPVPAPAVVALLHNFRTSRDTRVLVRSLAWPCRIPGCDHGSNRETRIPPRYLRLQGRGDRRFRRALRRVLGGASLRSRARCVSDRQCLSPGAGAGRVHRAAELQLQRHAGHGRVPDSRWLRHAPG